MNWSSVGREALLLVMAGLGPALLVLQQQHPTWTWIALVISCVSYVTTRMMPSPQQEKTIVLQQATIASLRPPPEKTP